MGRIESGAGSGEGNGTRGKAPATYFRRLDDMSGYDWDNNCNDYDYNECKPRRRRRHHKRYNDCWDYNYS